MRQFLIIACCLVATQAQAQKLRVLPPEEFDHPYEGTLVIVRAEQDEIRKYCWDQRYSIGPAIGCSVRAKNVKHCDVFIAPDADIKANGYDYATVLRHEIGHCNGWASNHWGAR